MEKTLHFIASYNSQIIQVGFGIVFLLIIIYVYRLFFMSEDSKSGLELSSNSEAIEEKLNFIINQQKNKVAVATNSASSQSALDVGTGHEIEIDRLKAEIYNLHQQLKEGAQNPRASAETSENLDAKSDGGKVNAARNDVNEISEEKIKLEEKVKNLESRLSEYEIIADDIAELSQLREENAKLTEQISLLKSETKTDTTFEEKIEEQIEVQIAEQTQEEVKEEVQPSLEDLVEMPPADEANPDEILSANESSPKPTDSTTNEEDQNLIDDFAKTVLKKENT